MFCNDAMLRIFGFARSEIDELDALSLLTPTDREAAVAVFTRVFETGEPAYTIDWEISTRDGSKILIEMSISLVTDVDDQPVGFRGIVRDVTERVRTAREKAISRCSSSAHNGWRPSAPSPAASRTTSTTS